MLLQWFRRGRERRAAAQALYGEIVRQAREPAFYREFGVADTLDGRFDLLVLHIFLALRRLRHQGGSAQAAAQALFDVMFADMDRSLREIGVSDHSIGRRVKEMVKAFYGRLAAYEQALNEPGELEAALLRNVYRGAELRAPEAARLAAYARQAAAQLDAQPLAAILAGNLRFAPPQER